MSNKEFTNVASLTGVEAKRSLLEGITLVERGADFAWLEYCELEEALSYGFCIVNDQKAEIYSKGVKHV